METLSPRGSEPAGGPTQRSVAQPITVPAAAVHTSSVAAENGTGARAPRALKRVFDCFYFLNELEALELRLAELYSVVDRFVICESNRTFRGDIRPLSLTKELPSRFARYQDKVDLLQVTDMQASAPPRDRESFQRNALRRGLVDLAPQDIVIVSDCDEIVSPVAIEYMRAHEGYFSLDMADYQFYVNMQAMPSGWLKAFAYSWDLDAEVGDFSVSRAQEQRSFRKFNGRNHRVRNAGWRFALLGGAERIRSKVRASSHSEVKIGQLAGAGAAERQLVTLREASGGSLLTYVEVDGSFPSVVQRNLAAYEKMGLVKRSTERISELENMITVYDRETRICEARLRYHKAEIEYLRQSRGDGHNVALNRPATQSSVSSWSRRPIPAEDASGANNGLITGDQGFHTDREDGPWWQVDLGRPTAIDQVWLFNRQVEAGRLRHFSIHGSVDATDWTILFQKTDTKVFGENFEPYIARIGDAPEVRFVRIRLDGVDWLHFDECMVFARTSQPRQHWIIARDAAMVTTDLETTLVA
jgi:hypothetical protein